ncbi:MAG: PilZ domain-containing protein [Burkholderiales bacterium]|nr:PilZ domain-containing protein [Burkholderiales bacterium]
MPLESAIPDSATAMRLQTGVRIQLLQGAARTRPVVSLVGYAPEEFLIVRTLTANGTASLQAGAPLTARLLSGQHVFSFATEVLRHYPPPANYWHLAWPVNVEGTRFRSAPRVDTDIPAVVELADGARAEAALGDIGVGGALLKSHALLGVRDEELKVRFRLPGADNAEMLLTAQIRNCQEPVERGARNRYGVQWLNPDDLSRLRVENFVYEQLLESRASG